MRGGIGFLIGIGGFVAWWIFFGVTWALLSKDLKRTPTDDDFGSLVFGSMLWPIVLPAMLGGAVVRRLQRSKDSSQ